MPQYGIKSSQLKAQTSAHTHAEAHANTQNKTKTNKTVYQMNAFA